MKKKGTEAGSTVLTIRVPAALDRRLDREARKRRRTRSETARALLELALKGPDDEDPAAEARRQSRLASRRASEREALAFSADASDLRGWE
jgi:predicted transcriptional regulator